MENQNYTLVDTVHKLKEMTAYLCKVRAFAIDTESTGLHSIRSNIIMIPITCNDRHWVIPVRMVTQTNVPIASVRKYLGPLLKNKRILKLLYNTKFDRHMFYNDNMVLRNTRDVMVMGWLLDENREKGLKPRSRDIGLELSKFKFNEYFKLRQRYINGGDNPVEDPGRKPTKKSFSKVEDYQAAVSWWEGAKAAFKEWKKDVKPLSPAMELKLIKLEEDMLSYAYEDTLATWGLWKHWEPELRKDTALWRVFNKVWNPYLTVLWKMERRGQCIDMAYLKKIQLQCADKISEAAKKVYSLAGKVFKIGSANELAALLYQDMRCPVLATSKKTGKPSADAGTLEMLSRIPSVKACPYGTPGFVARYPIMQAILEWRSYTKLYGTYVGPASKLVKAIHNGRVHTSLNACGTDTGRLSSSEPNLQNLPRNGPDNFYIRNMFIPPRGHRYMIADMSQIELRVIADKTKDPKLCQAYREGKDIHHETAVGCGLDPVGQRTIAKNLNFGAMYGVGDDKFSVMLTLNTGVYVSPAQAEQYLSAFFELYKEIPGYQRQCAARIRKFGYTRTYLGRKRRLPEIYSHNTWERSRAERQGFNAEIQGGVADIMTYCMLRFDRDPWMRKNRCFLVGQVHDEIHIIAPITVNPKELAKRTKAIFEDPFPKKKFCIPIKLSCPDTWAASWGEGK